MTHHAPPSPASSGADPGRQVAQLREALRLVDRIAGRTGMDPDALLDEAAWISEAYERALPIVQRRFDVLASETSVWAAAGVEALLAAGEDAPPRAAAACLAEGLDRALQDMTTLLR